VTNAASRSRAIVTGKIRNQMRLLKYFDTYEGQAAPARSAHIADLVQRLERIAATAEGIDGLPAIRFQCSSPPPASLGRRRDLPGLREAR